MVLRCSLTKYFHTLWNMHQFLTHFELNSKLNSVNWKENSVKTRWLCREGMDSFYISQKQRSFHWRCAAFFLCYSFFLKLRSQIHLWLHQVHEHIPRNEGVFYEVIHVEACRQYMLSTKTELLLYCMICLSFPSVIKSSLISSSSMEQTRQWKKNVWSVHIHVYKENRTVYPRFIL